MTNRHMPGLLLASLAAALGTACADDPIYLSPTPNALEVNAPAGMGPAVATLVLPIRLETQDEIDDRVALAMSLGLMPEQVAQARRDQFDVSLEWTVKNLENEPAVATVSLLGANEFFLYDPLAFVLDPEEDAPPPPLLGGEPVELPPGGTVSGVFREDEFFEAAQDLDALSRGGVAPQYAMLTQWETPDVTGGMGGALAEIPGEAIPAILQLDVSLAGNRHLVMEYMVRVRDHSDHRVQPTEMDVGTLVRPSTTPAAPIIPPVMP